MTIPLTSLADFVKARHLLAITGAGCSAPSGIPTYRDAQAQWQRSAPIQHKDFLTSEQSRRRYWARSFAGWPAVQSARPNRAHHALAALERSGNIACLVTQNVDGLHQRAGNSEEKVLQLHGTMQWVKCLGCGARHRFEEVRQWIESGVEVPECLQCGGILKPDAVFFGEAMPVWETAEATRRSSSCDLCIVIGSTLVVYPAGLMPQYAVSAGAKLVIINDGETALDHVADVRIAARAGEVMTLTMERLKEKLGVGS